MYRKGAKNFFIMAVLQMAVSQRQFRLVHEKIVIDEYNSDYIENPEITLFKYNDTEVTFSSVTIIKIDLTDKIWAHVKILQSINGGDYKLHPITLSLNVCEAQKMDTFGTRDILNYSNFTDCPFKKGTYYVKDYKPDETKFPAFVPRGNLILEGKIYDDEVFLGSGRWYGSVIDL